MKYFHRMVEDRLERLLRQFPVVVVTGARQTGKTTLVRHLQAGAPRLFRTLDDPESLDLASRDPETLLTEAPAVTVDEVQRRPELLSVIKRLVDRERTPGRFLLTGSANLLLMKGVSESLAGRAVYVVLRPMTESEKAGRPAPGPWGDWIRAKDAGDARAAVSRAADPGWRWTRAVLEGGYPIASAERDPAARREWFEGYVRTYVERDLRQLSQIDALVDFRRLMNVAALRAGRLVNQADLARDAGLRHATAHRYLNLLEVSFHVERAAPYSVSRTKRLMKMPRLFWGDVGLAAYLAGVEEEADLRRHESAGALLENLVWHHLRCWADAAGERADVLTWRTASGEEVDLVIETPRRLLPVEVKASVQVRPEDLRPMKAFLEEYADRAPFGVVLHSGPDCRLLADRILGVPLAAAIA